MIVTFYSFKGGVGRSMALVNVGEVLADRGYRVLLVDFDLEAPGLERYLADGDTQTENARIVDSLEAAPGLMDLIDDYQAVLRRPPANQAPDDPARQMMMGSIVVPRPSSYAVPVSTRRSRGAGGLWLLGAGRRDGEHYATYAERVRRFDWEEFYSRWSGDAFMDRLREELLDRGTDDGRFDLVLIDSRTGVTEHGGVCTHHLADLVVLLCAANDTNLDGTARMVESLKRPDLRTTRGRPLEILPIAARIEQQSQKDELVDFRGRFEEAFGRCVPDAVTAQRSSSMPFAVESEIPYMPYYAFRERVVAREKAGKREERLYAAYTTLASAIVACGPDMLRRDPAEALSDDLRIRRAAVALGAVGETAPVRGDVAFSAPVGIEVTEAYLHEVCERYRYLDLRGLGVADKVALRLPLSALFVPLLGRIEAPRRGEESDGGEESGQIEADERVAGRWLGPGSDVRLSEAAPVLETVAANDGVVVLGDPGSGKTTLLKQLAVVLALGDGEALGLEARLPVLVPLAAFAQAAGSALHDFVCRHAGQACGAPEAAMMIAEALDAGRALVLLDGLDEVRDREGRARVARAVERCFSRWRAAGNKLVITSRIVGYREVRLESEGLATVLLADFGAAEIEAFVRQWTAVLERQAQGASSAARHDAEREQRALLEAIRGNESLQRLAANPLLLTILALMKRQGVSLPERRVELYEQYVRTMLSSWNRARGLSRQNPSTARDLDVAVTVRVLAPLARWMHARDPGLGLASRKDLLGQLERLVAREGDADPAASAETFLDDVSDYAGLLVERGPEQFGFVHLTFEEYLAGVGLALECEGDVVALRRETAPLVGDPVWREPLRLLVGYLSLVQQLPTFAEQLLVAWLDEAPGPPGEAVVLVGQALLDLGRGRVDRQVRPRALEALVEALGAPDVPAATRLQAGDVLGRLGDPRPGVGVRRHRDIEVPDIAWHEVPAGTFWMGSDAGDDGVSKAETPKHELHLERFWIARYPITNAQYRCFLDAGGYDEPAYWTAAGRAWLRGDDEPDLSTIEHEKSRETLRAWLARRTWARRRRPWFWDDPRLAGANRPVVGVCWHEALAFARWLDGLGRAAGLDIDGVSAPEGFGVRLPSEAEWEKAARGNDGRRWPWGESFGDECANTEEAGLGETGPVGTFPAGRAPCGALDLVGNVWEWTRSAWGSSWSSMPDFGYPYDAGDGREVCEGSVLRALRGGSYFNKGNVARCSSRYWDDPESFNDSYGFRLVLSLAISES